MILEMSFRKIVSTLFFIDCPLVKYCDTCNMDETWKVVVKLVVISIIVMIVAAEIIRAYEIVKYDLLVYTKTSQTDIF